MNKKKEILEKYPGETFTFAVGLDKAILGVDSESMGIIYSTKKALVELKKQFPKYTKRDEVRDFFDFNTFGTKGKGWIWLDDEN